VSPVKYELRFYTPEDGILSSHRCESLKSYTLSLCSSFNATDQVSHPCRTTDKMIVFSIIIFTFFDYIPADSRFRADFTFYVNNNRAPLRSSVQSSWLLTRRSCVRFPELPDCLLSSGSGTGSTQPREHK
jgi:hypothetical protein